MTGTETTRIGVQVLPQLAASGALTPGGELGAYHLEHELGRGGMGVVFRARHAHLHRTVALKVLSPHLSDDPAFRDRFVRESRTAAALRHPHIVPVFDAGEVRGMLYLAMQLVEGTDLAVRLAEGPMQPRDALAILRQVASALDAAHEADLVHRDVKPANILIEGDHAYLSDFGLTKRSSAQTALTAAGQVVGTTDYLAPEQIEGRGVDARADVYALGCVLYHCLAGTPPFAGESDAQVLFAHVHKPPPPLAAARPDLPRALSETVARALAKDPLARHPGCSALVAAAIAAVDGSATGVAADAGVPRVVVAAPQSAALIRASVPPAEFQLEDVPAERLEATARAAPPDVLIFDAAAEDDAPGRCRALRAATREAGTSLIAIVRRGDEELVRRLAEAGADAHLAAPFAAMQLMVTLRRAVTAAS
jgi:serine/threonine-protein kinase